jgi:hypothetical protein
MNANDQVILVMKFLLSIAPPALYFVILGLVNSQSRPHLISSRNDWISLMVVFFPVVMYPIIGLAIGGYVTSSLIVIILIVIFGLMTLPQKNSGWVIYNCSKQSAEKAILHSLEKSGIAYTVNNIQGDIHLSDYDVHIKFSSLPILKNMTITFQGKTLPRPIVERLESCAADYLNQQYCGINFSGPAMLVAGTAMLILPLLMMVRHMDAFVRVVSDLLAV